MLVIVCPGQGSQTPGFLSPWLDLPGAREHLTSLSQAAGRDLVEHGTVSDAETIKDTAVAQPLIVAAGLMAAALLGDSLFDGVSPESSGTLLAGHSVGEITAGALAGALTEADAMTFVRERANAMAAAAAAEPTGMSAVLGGDPDEVADAIAAAGLTAANANGGGQTVAAGSLAALQQLTANPPAKARIIPLKVAGAFHTRYMTPAVTVLEDLRHALHPADPRVTLLSNHDGEPVRTGPENLDSLIAQVSRPVRWDLCMDTMVRMGVTGLLELPPAGTLAGLARRGMPGVATFALKTPDDLDGARSFIAEHAAAPQGPQ